MSQGLLVFLVLQNGRDLDVLVYIGEMQKF